MDSIVKNTMAQIIARCVHIASSLVFARIAISFLHRDGYGEYGFLSAIILLFATIADWGTNVIAVREASQNNKREQTIFSTILITRLGFSILALLLVNGLFLFYTPWRQYELAAATASFVLLFLSIKNSLLIVFQTHLHLDHAAVVDSVGSVLFVILTWFLLHSSLSVVSVMVAWLLATAVSVGVAIWYVKRVWSMQLMWDSKTFSGLIKEALPTGALLLTFSIYNRIDIIILERFAGVGAVAVYDLAYKVHGNLVLGAAFLMNSLFPLLSRSFSNDLARAKQLYRKSFGLLFLGGVGVAFVFWVFAGVVVYVYTGQQFLQFLESITALHILVFATAIAYLNHLTGYSLIALKKQRVSLAIALGALLFNATLNIILVPVFSWKASAVLTVFTELFVLISSSIAIWKTVRLAPSVLDVLEILRDLFVKRGKILTR